MRPLNLFQFTYPSCRSMALGLAQSLTEMSTKEAFLGSRALPACKTANFTAISELIV
jgi:hypothetical protein